MFGRCAFYDGNSPFIENGRNVEKVTIGAIEVLSVMRFEEHTCKPFNSKTCNMKVPIQSCTLLADECKETHSRFHVGLLRSKL